MKLNYVRRILFNNLPVSGVYLELTNTWTTIKNQKNYPEGLSQVLGELIAINILLTYNLKINGKITTQIQNNKLIDFIVSECRINPSNEDLLIRATAKFSSSTNTDLQMQYQDCLSSGHLVVSIDLDNNSRIYQSVVAIKSKNLSEDLEEYMLQSEQIKTKIMIRYTDEKIIAFMLQQLPDSLNKYDDDINRVFFIANTLTTNELECDTLETILNKLYSEDDIMLFDEQNICFSCTCSKDVVSNMLRTLGKKELMSILDEMGVIEVSCDYCNTKYSYFNNDVDHICSKLNINIEENISDEVH
jgi:molecular chaperone Hsp33